MNADPYTQPQPGAPVIAATPAAPPRPRPTTHAHPRSRHRGRGARGLRRRVRRRQCDRVEGQRQRRLRPHRPGANATASGRPGFGGGTSGTVGSVAAGQITITTAAGGSKIVLLTPTTTVTKVSSATGAVTDIASGNHVTGQWDREP